MRFWTCVFGLYKRRSLLRKDSTDDGVSWTTLWDASAQTGGWNYYASPIVIDLAIYEGLQVKIAWQAEDPPSNDGLWYVWFIDDIYIGNEITGVELYALRTGKKFRYCSSGICIRAYEIPDRNSKAVTRLHPEICLPAWTWHLCHPVAATEAWKATGCGD